MLDVVLAVAGGAPIVTGGGGALTVAFDVHLQNDWVMGETVNRGEGHGGITEHLMMPWSLTGESLMSGWLIRITPCMAVVCWSVIVGPGVGLI